MKRRKKDKAFALWLACQTQEEIAAAVEVSREAVSDWTEDFGKKLAADNLPNPHDFDPPLYNIARNRNPSRVML